MVAADIALSQDLTDLEVTADGNFSLDIPEGTETSVVSFIGVKTKEILKIFAKNSYRLVRFGTTGDDILIKCCSKQWYAREWLY
jgi:hypothetical protein